MNAMTATANLAENAIQPTKGKTPPRMIEVVHIETPHPEIKRVIFSGNALHGFPSDMNGSHIKLFFPKAHQQEPTLPTLRPKGPIWPSDFDRPIIRTYTVRYYDPLRNEIAIDFAWHAEQNPSHLGPAGRWLLQAKKGCRIGLAGPGGPDPLIQPATHQIFIGDTSALGAIWALTEEPSTNKRQVILIAEHNAVFELPAHAVKLFKPSNYSTLSALYSDLLRYLQNAMSHKGITPNSDLSAFIAGENALVLSVREYFKQAYGLTKKRMYAIPYWRHGQNEEAYHQTRHHIMDEAY